MSVKEYIIIDSAGYRLEKIRADDALPIADFDAATWIEIGDGGDYFTKRYVDSAWVDLVVTVIELRKERDKLIAGCDYTQLTDTALSDAKVAEWVTYRQALRDLPSGYTPVANPTYPTVPSA
tara:strand:- start:641 stop:1006 length:366 start_codon:yes stop_codon:yes gene_type:complete